MKALTPFERSGQITDPATLVQPLALRSMFWRPTYLERSAWHEHLPFAFWIMEALRPTAFVELGVHHGTSYFAFCQAVERLGLPTKCFGVDTWKGDEHAGFYDNNVFLKVRDYNDAHYSRFSRLVRSTFDEAVLHFSDSTVDLLHIDGLHTLEAVRHDLETWMPKLSSRAVVLFHDINVRERNFGVYKLFESLKERYPTFEFTHGHGLGIVGIGQDQHPLLKLLFSASEAEASNSAIQEIFSRLGRACIDTFVASQSKSEVEKLNVSLEAERKSNLELKSALEKKQLEVSKKTQELAEVSAQLKLQAENSSLQQGRLAERSVHLTEVQLELKDEVRRLKQKLDWHTDERAKSAAELTLLTQTRARNEEALRNASQHADQLHTFNLKLQTEAQTAQKEIFNVRILLAEAVAKLSQSEKVAAQSEAQRELLHAKLLEREQTRLNLDQNLQALEQQNRSLITQLQNANLELKAEQAKLADSEISLLQLKKDNEDLKEANSLLESAKQSIGASYDLIAERLESVQQQFEAAVVAHDAEKAELIKSLKYEQTERDSQIAQLAHAENSLAEINRVLDSTSEECAHFKVESQTLRQELTQVHLAVQVRDDEISSLNKQVHALQASAQCTESAHNSELHQMSTEKAALERELEILSRNVKDRFEELAVLTRSHLSVEKERDVERSEVNRLKSALESSHSKVADLLSSKAALCDKHTDDLARLELKHIEHLASKETQLKDLERSLAAAKQRVDEMNKVGTKVTELESALKDRFIEIAALTSTLDNQKKAEIELSNAYTASIQQTREKTEEVERLLKVLASQSAPEKEPKRARRSKATGSDIQEPATLEMVIAKSPLFDSEWYLNRYPDVKQQQMDAVDHYLRFGADEGRDPSPLFSTQAYYLSNPDVLKAKLNALAHYIIFGHKEGRQVQPSAQAMK